MKGLNRFFAAVFVVALAIPAFGAPVDPNSGVNVSGGAGSNWSGIQNGCRSSIAGLCIADASIPSGSDAFDAAATVSVDGTFYNAPTADLTGQFYTGDPATVSGLEVDLQYFFDDTDSVVRALSTMTNPGTSPVTATVRWQGNLGADSGIQVTGSASGDASFDLADGWVTTDDGNTSTGDPSTSFVLYGPGAPVTTSNVSLTTELDESGTQGVLADFQVTIGAGQTVAFLWFIGLDDSDTNAISRSQSLANLAPTDPLLSDLSQGQIDQIVNWDFGGGTGPAPAPAPAVQIPALSPASLVLLMLVLLGIGAATLRRVI